MRAFIPPAAAALLLLPMSSAASAGAEPAPCAGPIAPSGELAPWSTPRPLAAAGDVAGLAGVSLPVGTAAQVTLKRAADVRFALPPAKPGGATTFGGLIGFDVGQAGTYRVALSSGAWLDVVEAGKAVNSAAHGHGPACTGVRKMVDFALAPGRYTLQLSGNGEAQVTVLVARLPG